MKKENTFNSYLKKGYYQKQEFDSYSVMADTATNWALHCIYQLTPFSVTGENKVLMLDTIQLSFSRRTGGLMYSFKTPPGCISLAVIEDCRGKASLDNLKLEAGMVLLLDDKKTYVITNNETIDSTIISIPKVYGAIIEKCMTNIGYVMQDSNNLLLEMLDNILKKYLENTKFKEDIASLKSFESEIISVISTLLNEQRAIKISLTRGEEIALKIRDKAYQHMDGKIDIRSFAKEYSVSEQTIQEGFKSMFGYTPKRLLRLMKLNLVYKDLREGNSRMYTVTRIAQKWGFSHMGRFSQYYKELFGETPSVTLNNNYDTQQDLMSPTCISRQEEID